MSCHVELQKGNNGEVARVLLNGTPVPGLLRAQLDSGPRKATSLTLTLHPSSINWGEVSHGD